MIDYQCEPLTLTPKETKMKEESTEQMDWHVSLGRRCFGLGGVDLDGFRENAMLRKNPVDLVLAQVVIVGSTVIF